MKWEILSNKDSLVAYQKFCKSGDLDFAPTYQALRKDLCMLFYNSLTKIGIDESQISKKNYSYQVDLLFGIKLYTTLNEKYGMNVRLASTDGVWRYLSTRVVPDLIAKRYGTDHEDRFWKKPKRLWLRVLWWYIYLSWQGSEEETFSVLKYNSTDEILQLVDRCGRGGYRVDLYRALMKKNSQISLVERRKYQLFRKMMVLNTARVQAIEPSLTEGGNAAYVNSLYSYFL